MTQCSRVTALTAFPTLGRTREQAKRIRRWIADGFELGGTSGARRARDQSPQGGDGTAPFTRARNDYVRRHTLRSSSKPGRKNSNRNCVNGGRARGSRLQDLPAWGALYSESTPSASFLVF